MFGYNTKMHYIAAGSATSVALKVSFMGLIFSVELAVQLTGKSFYIGAQGK